MTLTFTYSDGTTVVCELDRDSVVAVDSPARNEDGSRINGRHPHTLAVSDEKSRRVLAGVTLT